MQRLLKVCLIIFVLLPVGLLQAQLKSQLPEKPSVKESIKIPGVGPSSFGISLLDPDRFVMNHSYSLSFINSGNYSTSLGIYQNLMSYAFSEKLWLNTRIGFMHNPLMMGTYNNSSNLLNNMIYGAELNYRPKDNVFLNVRFDSVPMYYRYRVSPFSRSFYTP